MSIDAERATPRELFWLKAGTASIWLTTALGVLHPYYRSVGHDWLSRLGLPDWLMWATCAGELVLAIVILVLPPKWWLMAAQVGGVTVFTLILAVLEPSLLAHPFGLLTKNLPFAALVITVWLISREGWTARASWILRGGTALIWITEGLFPKILFQQPMEVAVVANSGLVPMSAPVFLMLLGFAQVISGVLALVLKGRWLRWLLMAQVAALVVLPLLVSVQDPMLWFHPFGPMTKNFPIIAGTLGVLHRCSR
ncbi:MAG: DoxX-like family protein [Archangium sp.]|nr:DoxX-like family protein [Archangium sp.]